MKNKEEQNKKEINYNMLTLQFLGIILVVVGHKGGIVLFDNFFPLYSFHMPLFIFISGYFFNENTKFKTFFIKKTKKIIIPLFICNIIYLLINQILRTNNIVTYGSEINIYSIFIKPITYGNQSGLNLAAWFAMALFFTSLLYFVLRKLLKIITKSEYLITLVFLLLSLLGIYFAINGSHSEQMITITRIAFFSFFYQLGFLYKNKLESRDNLNSWIYFILLFSIQLVLLFFYDDLSFVLPNMSIVNNNIFLPIITSITGIFFWLRIAKKLSNIVKNSNIAIYIGQNTWTIMMHHQFIFFIINYLLYIINSKYINIKDFDTASFKYDPWYSFIPNKKYQFLIIYIICGIAIPLLLKWICENKLKLNNKLRR